MKFCLLTLLLWSTIPLFAQNITAFDAFPLTQCNPPYEVTFENFSQGDTAWHWDFGDGNSSFFPNPIHLYTTTGTFTVTLVTFGPGGSDTLTKTNYITTIAPPANPSVNLISDTINCGGNSQFIATGVQNLVWYDDQDQIVARGDTLDLPIVTKDAKYYVQSEDESMSMFVGPTSPSSVGSGSIFNGNQALTFNVLGDIRLKSVLVEAQGAGTREFVLEDTFGVILQTISVFIPDGSSRIDLDLELLPGNYRLRGDGVGLFRNNRGGTAYPYEIPGLIEITGSTAGNNFYYYFYDWEVATFCKSEKVEVEIMTNDLPKATTQQDTVPVPCGMPLTLIGTAPSELYWFDPSNKLLGKGDTIQAPFLGTPGYYQAKNAVQSPSFFLGPEDPDSLGKGTFVNVSDDSWLFFRVSSIINLTSVWVEADLAGQRSIEIIDGSGEVVSSYSLSLPAGKSRLNLNTELQPGQYQIGGRNLGLFQNDSISESYPFSLAGIVSITGSSGGKENYNYFYDWEVSTVCFSKGDSAYVELDPGPAPILNQDSLSLPCGVDTFLTATGSQITWYNEFNRAIATGSNLPLTNVSNSTTYTARTVAEGVPQKVGPADRSIGNGGYQIAFDEEGLRFEVYADLRLKSVLVDAQGSGVRELTLRTDNFVIIEKISVFIPNGVSRISLNIDLEPGTYDLVGENLSLYSNTDGFAFPYDLQGLMSITFPISFSQFAYHHFYDWEVARLCKSEATTAKVTVGPLAKPSVSVKDTICYQEQATFTASSASASWYDPNGVYIGTGKSLQTGPLTVGGTYKVQAEGGAVPQRLGPANPNAVSRSTSNDNEDPEYLVFRVDVPIRINSFFVEATQAGLRSLELYDLATQNLIETYDIFMEKGPQRINLGWELLPATYVLGGEKLKLVKNRSGASYPYTLPGLMEITSSIDFGFSSRAYNFFYDWEVQELPCTSDTVNFDVFVKPNLVADFSFVRNGATIDLINFAIAGTSSFWEFGDGNTSVAKNPTHTYASSGTYQVTLNVTDRNSCIKSKTRTINIPSGVGIDPILAASFSLYPNPGQGILQVKAQVDQRRSMQLSVSDLTGHVVYRSELIESTQFDKTLDLRHLAAGTYFLILEADEMRISRKYVLIK